MISIVIILPGCRLSAANMFVDKDRAIVIFILPLVVCLSCIYSLEMSQSGNTASESLTDSDETLLAMQNRIRELEKEKRKQEKEARVKELQAKIAELEREVCTSDGKHTDASGGEERESEGHSRPQSTTVEDLRRDRRLSRAASQRLKKLGLETSDSDSDDELDTCASLRGKKIRKSRRVRSGITDQVSDYCLNKQRWPQSALQYSYACKNVSFNNLEFPLFVAGEVEIISSSKISSDEKKGRLALLKLLSYKCIKYNWNVLRDCYAAWVHQIEQCFKTWKDDPTMVVSHILEESNISQGNPPAKFREQSKNHNQMVPLIHGSFQIITEISADCQTLMKLSLMVKLETYSTFVLLVGKKIRQNRSILSVHQPALI